MTLSVQVRTDIMLNPFNKNSVEERKKEKKKKKRKEANIKVVSEPCLVNLPRIFRDYVKSPTSGDYVKSRHSE